MPQQPTSGDFEVCALAANVQASTRGFLEELKGHTRAEDLRAAPDLIRQSGGPNYDKIGAAFALHYLWANARKVAAVLRASGVLGTSIVDLGSGPASASVGALLAAPHRNLAPRRVLLIDRSRFQLDLGARLLTEIADATGIELTIELLHRDLGDLDIEATVAGADLLLASHVLCENSWLADELVESASSVMTPGAHLVVVEQSDEALWSNELGPLGFSSQGISSTTEDSSLSLLGDEDMVYSGKTDWRSKAMVVAAAPERWMQHLVRGYFEAWNKQDPDLAASLFTDDATYIEKPYSSSFHGRDAIRRYWTERVQQAQSGVHATPVRIVYDPTTAWIDWHSNFARGDHFIDVSGMMTLTFDRRAQQIRTLREVFRTRARPELGAR